MKSLAGKLFFGAIWVLSFGTMIWSDWIRFEEGHLDASFWDFVLGSGPLLGQVALGAVCVVAIGALVSLIGPRVSRWTAASEASPPPDGAGPIYALRTFPVHVGLSVGLVAGVILTLFTWTAAAVLLMGPAIASWVLLARRMGLEPPIEPASPHNQPRSSHGTR